jgi:hypothetical protein
MKAKYTKEYFKKKFEAIPAENIGRDSLENKCALWHCGVRRSKKNGTYVLTDEAMALIRLFGGESGKESYIVYGVNDDSFSGNNAKENLLNKIMGL